MSKQQKSVASMLTSLDDLFTTQEERDDRQLERVRIIPLEELRPFKDHPFKNLEGEEMDRLTESIRRFGSITPPWPGLWWGEAMNWSPAIGGWKRAGAWAWRPCP